MTLYQLNTVAMGIVNTQANLGEIDFCKLESNKDDRFKFRVAVVTMFVHAVNSSRSCSQCHAVSVMPLAQRFYVREF